jgi:hypothetical protein
MLVKHAITSLTFAVLALLSIRVAAQDVRLQGVFANATQSNQPIKQAIDGAAAEFNFLTRPIARSRLTQTNPNVTRVEIVRVDDDITIQLGTRKPATARPGGAAVKWMRDDDEVFDLSLAWEGTTLVQSFSAPDGQRVNRYMLSSDGNTLTLDVTVMSERLKKPMKYTLTFIREATR